MAAGSGTAGGDIDLNLGLWCGPSTGKILSSRPTDAALIDNEQVVVSFLEDCNLSGQMVIDLIDNNKVPSRIILVFGGDVSTFERYPQPSKTGLCELELFHLSELILNVLRVQAEYKPITTEEMECLSKKGVEIARVHPEEFISRYFALDEGEVVKCTPYPEISQANTGAENDEDEECGCGYNSYEDCKIVPKEISDVLLHRLNGS